jgi:FMN phosphatase YigB (HAD superfamily)/membrane-associated phospholipid phosphatase
VPAAEHIRRIGRQRRVYLIAAAAGLAAFIVAAVLMRTGVLDGFDERVVNLFAGHRREPFTTIAEVFDFLDTWWLLILLVAAFVGGLWWSGRMVQAVYFGVTMCVALVLNPLLKLAFERVPPGSDQAGVQTAVYAFPSGHTTSATAAATALAIIFWPTRWRWPVLVAAVLFPLGMAVSRVYLGAHWPTDVAGGLALGLTIAMAVRALMPWPTPQEAAAAQAEPASTTGTPVAAVTSAAADDGQAGRGIDVVFLDWGNTLMVDNGMREGPMKDWDKVEAEAGAQEALLRLRARYRIVVATNATDSPAYFVRLALARVGLDDSVDEVISSTDVGDHKPNYAFFRAALLQEGERGIPLDPRRAVMVGDGTTNDIAGAQRAGMRTIWYNPTKRRFPDGAQPPDVVIKKLSDLPEAVDRLAGLQPAKRSRKQRKADADAAAALAAAAAARDLRAATAAEDSAASAAAAVLTTEAPPVDEHATDESAPDETAASSPAAGESAASEGVAAASDAVAASGDDAQAGETTAAEPDLTPITESAPAEGTHTAQEDATTGADELTETPADPDGR